MSRNKTTFKKKTTFKTKYKLLRTSWKVQTNLFFENSTLHGVRYIAEEGRPVIEKFINKHSKKFRFSIYFTPSKKIALYANWLRNRFNKNTIDDQENDPNCFNEGDDSKGFTYSTYSSRSSVGTRYKQRLMWFCCVCIGAIATAVIIVSLWEKFQTNPTITGLDTDFHSWNLPFPAITICQSIPSSKKNIQRFMKAHYPTVNNTKDLEEFLEELSLLSFRNVVNFKKYTNKGYIENDTKIKNFIFEFINPCEEIFENCFWKSEPYNCCDGFFPVFTETGICYSFNSRHYEKKIPKSNKELPAFEMRYIKETDIKWSLKFSVLEFNDAIKYPVYIHNSDEMPGLDMEPQITWNFKVERVAFSMKQTYTTDDTRQLSVKQRHCIFENELQLKIDHMYTYTACTRQCRMENSKKICGCVPHFYAELDTFRHCKINELSCIADHIKDIESIEKCSCQLGCFNTVYDVEKLIVHNSADSGDLNRDLEAEFVSWPMVRYKREVLFGWVDLLVSFGGIAGLFLGFSLLSGVEVIYYFTMRACCMVFREPKELEKQQKHYEIKQDILKLKNNYDLSLVPYFINRISTKNEKDIPAMKNYNGNFVPQHLLKVKPSNWEKKKKIADIYPPFGIEFLP